MDKRERFTDFFAYVTKNFAFLESEYNFKKLSEQIVSEDWTEDTACITYIGSSICLYLIWNLVYGVITVAFFELENGEFPSQLTYFAINTEYSHTIDIFSLVTFITKGKSTEFLLGDIYSNKHSKVDKRNKVSVQALKREGEGRPAQLALMASVRKESRCLSCLRHVALTVKIRSTKRLPNTL